MSTKGSLWAGLEPAHPPAFDNDINQHRVYAYKKKQRSYQQERHISILGGVFFFIHHRRSSRFYEASNQNHPLFELSELTTPLVGCQFPRCMPHLPLRGQRILA